MLPQIFVTLIFEQISDIRATNTGIQKGLRFFFLLKRSLYILISRFHTLTVRPYCGIFVSQLLELRGAHLATHSVYFIISVINDEFHKEFSPKKQLGKLKGTGELFCHGYGVRKRSNVEKLSILLM